MPEKKRSTNGHARRNGDAERSGETHQIAGPDEPVLTTRQGLPVADDQNTLRRGALDGGYVALDEEGAEAFVEQCRTMRFWDRELLVTTARP